MQIILKKDLPGLGYEYDIVDVRNGYAANYLIPQGYAEALTAKNKKSLLHNLEQRAHKIAEKKKAAEALSAKIEGLTLSLGAKVGEKGKIYGSISSQNLAQALEEKSITLSASQISVPASVKSVGEHTAVVVLHKEVKATLKFKVVPLERKSTT